MASPQRATTAISPWKNLPPELKMRIFESLDLVFEIQPGTFVPDNLTAFCLSKSDKTGSNGAKAALKIYHERNFVMTRQTLGRWNTLNRHQLMRIQHLYIVLDSDTGPVSAALLNGNSLYTNNNLHSITIDLSRMIVPPSLRVQNSWESRIMSVIISLIETSNGCVNKVSLVLGAAQCPAAYVIVHSLRRVFWSITPSFIRRLSSRNLKEQVWSASRDIIAQTLLLSKSNGDQVRTYAEAASS
ncbi:uncharacterized protein PAC_09563 [Phialocephala subalpina]|uniref:Uncharacterized protein n=1 Tax=Phialocephala subalpina TaxID=576137 RepID=A0A1L7X3R7_9HELO|nr:uncharacterized protein PAC_09563 [Phialocephala subalpina]